MTFTLPTRAALLEHRRRQTEDGYLFPLAATSIGMDDLLQARVRRLNTTDRASIEQLPQAAQEIVWRGMKEFEAEQKKLTEQGKADSLIEAVTSNEKVLLAANALVIAAFIEPVIVATEAEVRDGAWTVDDVAAEDRISFFFACADADSASAKQLKLFRPKPSVDVPGGTVGRLDAFPTERPAEHAG